MIYQKILNQKLKILLAKTVDYCSCFNYLFLFRNIIDNFYLLFYLYKFNIIVLKNSKLKTKTYFVFTQ